MRVAIEGGITNLALANNLPMIVNLLGQDFINLGIALPTAGSATALTVSVCDILALKGIGLELVRTRELLTVLRARRAAEDIGSESATEEVPELPPEVETSPPQFPAFLEEKVYGQISQLPSIPEMPVKPPTSLAEELITLKGHINELELSSGPANVTAFRDFHALQMAFEDVWTAAFDESLIETVKELYREVTALDADYGVNFPRLESTRNVNDLIGYLNSMPSLRRYRNTCVRSIRS
jgi:hypothetical protein